MDGNRRTLFSDAIARMIPLLNPQRERVFHHGMKSLLPSLVVLSIATLMSTSPAPAAAAAGQQLVYFGTYTGKKSQGIYVSRLDLATGALSKPELAVETKSPSFLAIHPNKKFLFAVGEINDFEGKKAGGVSSFAIDAATGKLTLLSAQSSGTPGPCHVSVDHAGKVALVANYGGGSVAALPIAADGKLSPASTHIQHGGVAADGRPLQPHAHSINVSKDNKFAFAADLGLDKVLVYKLDPATGGLAANDPAFTAVPTGSGPRHFAFHPSGRFAYVINERTMTMTAFSYDEKRGELKVIETVSTLPPGETVQKGQSTAEVQVHPSGKFVYGSNRGHHTIVVFAVDEKTGRLTHVENTSTQGKTPRNFGIDPTGAFLLAANQDTDNVFVYRIDSKTGKLTPTGGSVEVGSPVCVKFLTVK